MSESALRTLGLANQLSSHLTFYADDQQSRSDNICLQFRCVFISAQSSTILFKNKNCLQTVYKLFQTKE